MGLFRRKQPAAVTPVRGRCSCPEHVEELTGLVVPVTSDMAQVEPFRVGDLIEMHALGVSPAGLVTWQDHDTGQQRGPFHFELWVGDEARCCYDDAALPMDQSLLARPGIEAVEWEDREVFHLAAPTLCADGVLAAAARALLDPRVRT